MFTSKLIGGWIPRPDMQMLFKFHANWIKIEDFRNLAYVDLFSNGNHKNNRWLNSVIWYVNLFQISTQMKIEDLENLAQIGLLVYVDLLADVYIKIVGGWIQWPDMQMLLKFQVDRMKIEILENLAQIGLLAYFDLLAYVYLKINRWLNSVTWYANGLQISRQLDQNWGF